MKRQIFILALLIFIVSMGCVSAADESVSDDVLAGNFEGNFGDLFDLIDNANEGDTITLNDDYDGSGEITIDKGIIIDGDGHTINANNKSRIFYVDAKSEVVIFNTVFTGGYDETAGGAIIAESPLYIDYCEFYYNTAYGDVDGGYGGAIHSSSELSIIDSYFEANIADSGGAVHSEGDLYINNTGFLDNYAYWGGGAVSGYYSNMVINASGFENNSAAEYGSSIYAGQILEVANSVFISETENMEIIDYYNDDDVNNEFYLYLENNEMQTPNDYSIWFESVNKIVSPVNLVFAEGSAKKGDEIEAAAVCDDMGNVILYDYDITMNIYKGKSLVKTVDLKYDYNKRGIYYECDLDDGTYTLTGSLSSEYVDDLTVQDGELVVGSSSTGKTTPKVTASYTRNGNSVTLSATIDHSDATGTVTFNVNNQNYNENVKNGKATKTLTLADGSYTVKTSYGGDANYNSANGNQITFTISSSGVNIDAPALTKYFGSPDRFTVTLTENGNPLSGKTVKININGQTYERTTDSSGKAGMNINLNSAEYPVSVEAEGQQVTSTVTVRPTVSGNDITKIFRNATQYYATFIDTQGNLLKNTDVEFNINGVFYTRKTNENGVARMNINLNPETYVITAKNPSTGEQYTNTITVLTNIIEHNDLTKYYKNESQYRIRILADDGSIAKAGVKVTFNINGVFYDRYSDDDGYVQMRINLNPGDYIITADYNGLRASNNIKVLSRLSGNNMEMSYRDGSSYEVTFIDGTGNPFADQQITFNINGVLYPKTTDCSGHASLKINLDKGQYIITATSTYGDAISNTINIKDSSSNTNTENTESNTNTENTQPKEDTRIYFGKKDPKYGLMIRYAYHYNDAGLCDGMEVYPNLADYSGNILVKSLTVYCYYESGGLYKKDTCMSNSTYVAGNKLDSGFVPSSGKGSVKFVFEGDSTYNGSENTFTF